MSFALVHQNKTGDSKPSMPAKAILYHSNNSARSSHDSVIHPQCTFGNQCVQTFIPSGTGFDFGKMITDSGDVIKLPSMHALKMNVNAPMDDVKYALAQSDYATAYQIINRQ